MSHNLNVTEIFNHQLKGNDGKFHTLKDYHGKNIIVYFYPKDDTPGCTIQGKTYSELLSEFQQLNTIVFGVSKDSVESKIKFADKYGYKHILLADPDLQFCALFDVLSEKKLFGKIRKSITRSSFIFDETGKLISANIGVSAKSDAEDNLNFLKNNK
ncbi:peroxiredoxin [Mycoplasma sp. SG1]|uniref:peroxiredoxin n=1 Tax=Mycoplasma sp. SG1 TaxID=2810348 RepID=UPI002023FD87|nr:peroxiredoxin [Mycoplasma sp. SG1]URM53044.1 peroxiredoxin [Mycoplasma sp. SG1]